MADLTKHEFYENLTVVWIWIAGVAFLDSYSRHAIWSECFIWIVPAGAAIGSAVRQRRYRNDGP